MTKRLKIHLKPNAKKREIVELADGSWEARVKSLPVEGKANRELIELIAEHFGISKSRVALAAGGKSRYKIIDID